MNLRRLKYFVKIVDIGSLTQAAEVLHIAQPALSQQVATLEGEMDQQLLIRTKRGVTPTEAGKILYTHARTILRQCEQARSRDHIEGRLLSPAAHKRHHAAEPSHLLGGDIVSGMFGQAGIEDAIDRRMRRQQIDDRRRVRAMAIHAYTERLDTPQPLEPALGFDHLLEQRSRASRFG